MKRVENSGKAGLQKIILFTEDSTGFTNGA